MSVSITPKDVDKIASLARLGLTEQEIQNRTNDLAKILDHFASIQSIETNETPTYDKVAGETNITREDTAFPNELCSPADLLQRAPDLGRGHIKVKAVFD